MSDAFDRPTHSTHSSRPNFPFLSPWPHRRHQPAWALQVQLDNEAMGEAAMGTSDSPEEYQQRYQEATQPVVTEEDYPNISRPRRAEAEEDYPNISHPRRAEVEEEVEMWEHYAHHLEGLVDTLVPTPVDDIKIMTALTTMTVKFEQIDLTEDQKEYQAFINNTDDTSAHAAQERERAVPPLSAEQLRELDDFEWRQMRDLYR